MVSVLSPASAHSLAAKLKQNWKCQLPVWGVRQLWVADTPPPYFPAKPTSPLCWSQNLVIQPHVQIAHNCQLLLLSGIRPYCLPSPATWLSPCPAAAPVMGGSESRAHTRLDPLNLKTSGDLKWRKHYMATGVHSMISLTHLTLLAFPASAWPLVLVLSLLAFDAFFHVPHRAIRWK